jgi:hypothetical protein
LAVWRIGQPTAKLKSTNIKSFAYFAHAKAIMHREVTWWVWSLGSSNNLWTTRHSLESLLLCPDLSRLVFDLSYNLSLMIGLQKKVCPRMQLARSMEALLV